MATPNSSSTNSRWKRALVSVSNKTGLVDLLKPLAAEGLEIVSTGGTAQFLRDNGFKTIDISEVTGFPEVMDGRVKTLHPNVHMGLLGRRDIPEHMSTMEKLGGKPFDLVVVNLYPFEEAVHKKAGFEELIEKIDIGGPSMLRSAAKNFASVAVLCDPNDYAWFLGERGAWSAEKGQKLAAKVYAHTSVYDGLIARELGYPGPELHPLGGKLVQKLRYGENPTQQASWYRYPEDSTGLSSSKIIQGKELSYNNLLDLEASAALVRHFKEPAAVAVKHNNPCGAAQASTLDEAVRLTLAADTVSVFGGIVALNREVGAAEANRLAEIFLECIVAPSFSAEALEIFAKKKNLRILAWPDIMKPSKHAEVRSVAGGYVVQSADSFAADHAQGNWPSQWTVTGEKPGTERQKDLLFGEKIGAYLKSNSIAIVAHGQTVGLGMGQVNRIDAVEQAIGRWRKHHPQIEPSEVCLISDAFFPFSDSVDTIAKAGIRWVLQPGGAMRDEEVKAAATKYGINMIFTGDRHFKH